VKDKLYTYEDTIKISIITLAVGEEEKVNSNAKKERLEIIKKLKERLDKGEDFEKVFKDVTSKGIKGLTITVRTLDKDTARNNSREEPFLLDAVNNLSPSGISDVFEENSSFNIAKCIDRKEGEYKSFEDVKESVKSSYINERYDEIIKNLIKDASSEVNDKVYQSIKNMD
jgi:foldase protein PrsA